MSKLKIKSNKRANYILAIVLIMIIVIQQITITSSIRVEAADPIVIETYKKPPFISIEASIENKLARQDYLNKTLEGAIENLRELTARQEELAIKLPKYKMQLEEANKGMNVRDYATMGEGQSLKTLKQDISRDIKNTEVELFYNETYHIGEAQNIEAKLRAEAQKVKQDITNLTENLTPLEFENFANSLETKIISADKKILRDKQNIDRLITHKFETAAGGTIIDPYIEGEGLFGNQNYRYDEATKLKLDKADKEIARLSKMIDYNETTIKKFKRFERQFRIYDNVPRLFPEFAESGRRIGKLIARATEGDLKAIGFLLNEKAFIGKLSQEKLTELNGHLKKAEKLAGLNILEGSPAWNKRIGKIKSLIGLAVILIGTHVISEEFLTEESLPGLLPGASQRKLGDY